MSDTDGGASLAPGHLCRAHYYIQTASPVKTQFFVI